MSMEKDPTQGSLPVEALDGWEIVLPAEFSPAEEHAAAELQRALARRTDHKLPRRAGEPGRAGCISLEFDAELGDEAFRVEVAPDRVSIAGGRPRGVLYGVYEFLEEFLGIRFLTFDHTHFPQGPVAPIPCGTYRYAPPFSFRWSYYRENADHPEFAARLRVNTVSDDEHLGGRTPQNLINHSVQAQVPFARYGAEHPEYYALVDGKRDTDTRGGGPQLCVTNPEVIEIAARAVIEHLDQHPHLRNVSVSQADTDRYCRCPDCEAINQREGTPMGAQLAFVNAVAERVEKKHPQVKIGTLAYWYTRRRPRTLRPRANVQIQLCSIECCTLHPIDDPDCERNREFCRDMEEWSEVCDDIWVWNYNTNFRAYDLPFPNLRSIGPNVRYFLEHHARGVFMQANGSGSSGEFSDLRNYLIGRVLWDPHADGEVLRREFLQLHYGDAAQPLEEYLQMLHDNAESRGLHPTCFPTPEQVGLDAEVARRILEYFDRALSLAGDATIRARVEKASITAYRAMLATEAWRDPEERQHLVQRYIALAQIHGMSHAAEHQPAEDYFTELRSS